MTTTNPPADDVDPGVDPDTESARRSTLGGPRTTVALVAVLVLLVATLAGEGWYLLLRDDPVASAQRPVVTGLVTHRTAVETASRSTEEILSRSFRDYDAQVDRASSLMTGAFAEEYRQTVEDIKGDFIKTRTQLQMTVVAAGVVRAAPDQVQALLFLNQYVSKRGQDTSFTPYRALVTVVRSDQGWLVSAIDTK